MDPKPDQPQICSAEAPAVYARVSYVLEWIDDVIKGTAPPSPPKPYAPLPGLPSSSPLPGLPSSSAAAGSFGLTLFIIPLMHIFAHAAPQFLY